MEQSRIFLDDKLDVENCIRIFFSNNFQKLAFKRDLFKRTNKRNIVKAALFLLD